MSKQEILDNVDLLKEDIRHYLSWHLQQTSEKLPKVCNIILETPNDCGLSDLLKPCIESIFEDCEGIIWINTDYYDSPIELDDFDLDTQIQIVKELCVN